MERRRSGGPAAGRLEQLLGQLSEATGGDVDADAARAERAAAAAGRLAVLLPLLAILVGVALGAERGQVLVLEGEGTSIGLLVDEVVGIERVAEEAAGPPAGQRSPLVAVVLGGTRPLLLLDVGALTGWLAP